MTRAQKTDLLIIIAILAGIAAVVLWLASMGSIGVPLAGESCKHAGDCDATSGSNLGKAIGALLATISVASVTAVIVRRAAPPETPGS